MSNKTIRKAVRIINRLTAVFTIITLGMIGLYASTAWTQSISGQSTSDATSHDHSLDQRAQSTLKACQRMSPSCAQATKNAVGILVFPSVVKADLILGGSGGKGALIENGQITGYYSLGVVSAGLQVGIDQSSQVYVFRNAQAVSNLKNGMEWKVGATADVTLVSTNAAAQTMNGSTLAYIFNSSGLEGGLSLGAFDVWKTGQPRPQSSASNTSPPDTGTGSTAGTMGMQGQSEGQSGNTGGQ